MTNPLDAIRERLEKALAFENEYADDSDATNNAETNGYFPPRPSEQEFVEYQECLEARASDIALLLALVREYKRALDEIRWCGRDSHRLGCPDECPSQIAQRTLKKGEEILRG